MDVLKCVAFVTAVEQGSIFSASEKLNYTPSGVNRMISSLEDELNVILLSRSRTGVSLTEIGARLMPVIREFIECSDKVHEICKEERNFAHESITIGAYHFITEMVLPAVLNRFKAQYPGVQINVVEGPHSMLLPMLTENDLDCCILCDPFDQRFSFEPLYREQILILEKEKDCTHSGSFPVSELRKHPYICFGDYPVELKKIIEDNDIQLNISCTTRSIHTMSKMVEEGLGISAEGETAFKNCTDRIVGLPLDPPAFIDIGITLHQERIRPIVRRFADLVISSFSI